MYAQLELERMRVALNTELHWLREKSAVLDVEVTWLEALTRSIARSSGRQYGELVVQHAPTLDPEPVS